MLRSFAILLLLIPVVARATADAATPAPAAIDDTYRPASTVLALARRPVPEQPDWAGMRKDTGYFLSYQFIVIGVLYVVPESVSGWTPEQKNSWSVAKWKNNIRHVVWDTDDWYINYILHPYWGATYYVRAQQRGFGPAGSFWYAMGLSTIYEFGAEAMFERPSIQDMIFTPVGGAFIGDYFMTVRADILKRAELTGEIGRLDKFLLVATDPLGVLNGVVEGAFGRDTTVSLQPVFGPVAVPAQHETAFHDTAQAFILSDPMIGVKTTIHW